MALPQNPNGLTAGDRELLEASVAQSKTLQAQTKVLQKLSDNIKDQKKEYSKLRDDIKELRKGFYTGDNKGFEEIKKYFQKSKEPGGFTSRSKIGVDDKDKEQKGFFRSAISKLFGPSKYQQKMMDDTSEIRRLTETFQEDISFIKREYEEPARARERELLAQAIADKINKNSEGGGGGGGGILGALGTAVGFLIKELADIFKSVVGNIVQGVSNIIRDVIKSVTDVLKELLEWTKIGTRTAQSCCAGKALPGLPEAERRDRTNPNSGQQRIPGGQQQLPGQNLPQIGNDQKQLPAPPQQTPSDINKRMEDRMNKNSGGVSDAKMAGGLKQRLIGLLSGFTAGRLALGALGITVGVGAAAGAVAYGVGDLLDNADSKNPEDPYGIVGSLDKLLGKKDKDTTGKVVSGKIEAKYKDFGMGPGVDPDAALGANNTSYITEGFAERLKATFEKVIDNIEEGAIEYGTDAANYVKSKLNTIGEITMANGEKVNLLPNLGTGLFDILSDQAKQAKNYADQLENLAMDKVVNIVNQQNNVSSAPAAPMILPSASSVNTRPEIQQMLMGGVVIGGRRYH